MALRFHTGKPICNSCTAIVSRSLSGFARHVQSPRFRLVRINGFLFFGAVDCVRRALLQIDENKPRQKTVMVLARGINFVNRAGAEMPEILTSER